MAVELLPEDQWRAPSKVLPGGGGGGGEGGGEGGEADDEAARDAAGAALFEARARGGERDSAWVHGQQIPHPRVWPVAPCAGPRLCPAVHPAFHTPPPRACRAQVAPAEPPPPDADPSTGARPTGRVVGVLKRNWRARGYCGSLKPEDVAGGGGALSLLFVPVERRFPMIRCVCMCGGGGGARGSGGSKVSALPLPPAPPAAAFPPRPRARPTPPPAPPPAASPRARAPRS